jgi:hypothetical protein
MDDWTVRDLKVRRAMRHAWLIRDRELRDAVAAQAARYTTLQARASSAPPPAHAKRLHHTLRKMLYSVRGWHRFVRNAAL